MWLWSLKVQQRAPSAAPLITPFTLWLHQCSRRCRRKHGWWPRRELIHCWAGTMAGKEKDRVCLPTMEQPFNKSFVSQQQNHKYRCASQGCFWTIFSCKIWLMQQPHQGAMIQPCRTNCIPIHTHDSCRPVNKQGHKLWSYKTFQLIQHMMHKIQGERRPTEEQLKSNWRATVTQVVFTLPRNNKSPSKKCFPEMFFFSAYLIYCCVWNPQLQTSFRSQSV